MHCASLHGRGWKLTDKAGPVPAIHQGCAVFKGMGVTELVGHALCKSQAAICGRCLKVPYLNEEGMLLQLTAEQQAPNATGIAWT